MRFRLSAPLGRWVIRVPYGDVAGDGEAETGSAVVTGAWLVEAYETAGVGDRFARRG